MLVAVSLACARRSRTRDGARRSRSTSRSSRRIRAIRSRRRGAADRSDDHRRRRTCRSTSSSIVDDDAKQPVDDQGGEAPRVHRGHRDDRDRARHQRPGDLDRQRRLRDRGRAVEVRRRAQEPVAARSTSCSSATAGPPGSKGIVISYSTGAEIKVPMGAARRASPAPRSAARRTTRARSAPTWCRASRMAIAELRKVATARKALIVVGDGNDTNTEAAKAPARAAQEAGAQDRTSSCSRSSTSRQLSSEGNVITTMIPTAKTVNSIDGIATRAQRDRRAHGRSLLPRRSPATTTRSKQGLPWDGKEHDLSSRSTRTELEPVTLALAPMWSPPKTGGFPWLVVDHRRRRRCSCSSSSA